MGFRRRRVKSRLGSSACNPGLPSENRALSGESPMVAGQLPGAAKHAMAGHDEGDRVLADRRADGSRRVRLVDPTSHVGVGRGAGERNFEQRLPDADLEIRADEDDAERRLRPPLARIEDSASERRGAQRCSRRMWPSASAASCRQASPSPALGRQRRGRRGRTRSP